jgi:hypothetical protein
MTLCCGVPNCPSRRARCPSAGNFSWLEKAFEFVLGVKTLNARRLRDPFCYFGFGKARALP